MRTFKQYLKESWTPDSQTISWLKDYLKDVKNGYGWVDIDKVVYDADIELNKDFSKNKKELADYIKKFGYGSILRESTWTDYYDQIVDLDFNPSTGSSKYKNRKDLEAALVKTYKWNVKSPDVKEALDRYFAESAKVVKEAKKNDTDISFDNIASGIRIGLMYDGLALNTFSGGNGFNGSWKSKEFDELYSARDIDAINKIAQSIANDLYSAASKFDSEIEKIMKKHGFKK